MEYGDKLVLKEIKDILEVTGVFPSSQGFRVESGEKYLAIVMCGHVAYIPECVAESFMVKYEPKPIVIETTVSEIIEKTVEEEIKVPKKKKIKKGK